MRRRLLCIGLGVDEYDDRWLAPLSFADLDVQGLQNALVSVPGAQVQVLPLKSDINAVDAMAQIRKFLGDEKVRQGDRVLFCFAGHGIAVADGGGEERQYLLLRRADPRSLEQGHIAGNDVLAVHSLLALFDEFPATFALLIDACRLPAQHPSGPLIGQTRDAIRVGLVGRAMAGLRPAVPRRHGPGAPEPAAPMAGAGAAGNLADLRHLLVYSSESFDQAHEVSSLGGGLFLSTFTAWLKEKLHADELAVIDQDWVTVMADRMSAAARSVQVTIPQRPWISHPSRAFALHRPADPPAASQAPAVPHAPPPPGRTAAPTPPMPPPVDHWPSAWIRCQPVSEPWCPVFILLSPALTGLGQGLAIMEDPVTWSQWWAAMGQRPAAMPAASSRSVGDSVPVTWVSRADCEAFAARLTARLAGTLRLGRSQPLRLPSNQEWTLACACGPVAPVQRSAGSLTATEAVFRWSSLGHARKNNPSTPQPVAHPLHRPNAWGVRGMHGNVRELAWHHRDAARCLAMGGSFLSEVQDLRPDHSVQFSAPCEDVGFRLVRLLQPGEASVLVEGSKQP